LPELGAGEIGTAKRGKLRAPHREAEGHAPGVMAGKEYADGKCANGDGADDDRRARLEIRAARTRERDDQQRRRRNAGERHREPTPRAEIVRGEHRIDATEPQKRRQMQTADHAAGDEQRERDQHAPRTPTRRIERAGAAAVSKLHADAEHERTDDERWPDRRNRAAEANLSTAIAQGRRIQNQREQVAQTIEADVRSAMQLMQSAELRLEAARIQRESAEEQYNSEQRQFRAGTSTLFLVQQRQTTMISARSQERRAESDLGEAVSAYELATGSILRQHNINLQ